jgi:hypothetical protein
VPKESVLKTLCPILGVGAFLVIVDSAEAPPVEYGPPASPLSWQEIEPAKSGETPAFAPRGVELQQPASVKRVEFQDRRPYGEVGHRDIWLARYESVPVRRPDSTFAAVTVSLAFDAEAGNLFCAFTDPTPTWAKPKGYLGDDDIEAKMSERWRVFPARYGELRSTLTEVLAAAWRHCGADPGREGQIIVRPRWIQNKLRKSNPTDPDGPTLPPDPACNMWIIEVLGAFIMERYGANLTTQIAVIRDGDLHYTGGMYLP